MLAWIYVGWVFIGYIITQKFGYYYQVGWEYIGGAVVAFTLLEEICDYLSSYLRKATDMDSLRLCIRPHRRPRGVHKEGRKQEGRLPAASKVGVETAGVFFRPIQGQSVCVWVASDSFVDFRVFSFLLSRNSRLD
jgi:hypothetical protein